MDPSAWQRLETLFAEAIALPPSRWDAFVARRAADDPALRDELRSLLDAHASADNPLDRPPLAVLAGAAGSQTLAEGTRIGVWRVGALINIGGAGEVYFATRADGAFDQRAALKRLYRETAPDLARFLAERQILASLEHPGIARLLDGGVADDGRLYAVVEYVDGRSLVEHCAAERCDLDRRLALFLQVCDVVAYAHRNLVVHRDLKPGNILVTADGRVKLLDFGVAKRLDRNAGNSDATGAATAAPFTSDYAAPEQLTGAPITTATDVYALGVILHELLTGTRPWRTEGLPIARVVQQIVHGEPPAMSRVAAAGDGPVPAAKLAGDLDAIVATCLRKEAASRYPTVDALRRDIERHCANEPVAARGRARSYLFGRAVKRYRWAFAGGTALFATLAIGLAATIWQARRAEIERDAARRAATREEAIRDQIVALFRASIAENDDGAKGANAVTAKAMLDRSAKRLLAQYRDDPQLVGKVVVPLADLYGALEDVEGQAALLEAYLAAATGPSADGEAVALARQKLAQNDLLRGQAKPAAELLPKAEAFWNTAPERYREQRLEALFVRALLSRSQGDLDGAIRTYRDAIAERVAYSGLVHRETASLYNSLAITLTGANRLDEAFDAYRTSLDVFDQLGLSEDVEALVILGNTGTLAYRMGRVRDAETILQTAYTKQRARGGDSAAVAASMGLYGASLTALGRAKEAVDVLDAAVAMSTKFVGADSPLSLQNRVFLSEALLGDGRLADARDAASKNVATARAKMGDAATLTQRTKLVVARIDLVGGRPDLAADEFAAAADALAKGGPVARPWVASALVGRGDALLAEGRPADAVAPLEAAVAIRQQLLAPNNWELALARVRLGEAMKKSRRAGGDALLEQGLVALSAQLGADHPEVARARKALAATA